MFCTYIIVAAAYIIHKLYWTNLRNLVDRTYDCSLYVNKVVSFSCKYHMLACTREWTMTDMFCTYNIAAVVHIVNKLYSMNVRLYIWLLFIVCK